MALANFLTAALLAQGNGIPDLTMYIPLIAIGFLFYFMMIRPERQKRVELEKLQRSLKKNDRVLTFAGIYGTVVNAQQDSEDITIKVDENSNTRLRVTRNSIQQVLGKGESDESKTGS